MSWCGWKSLHLVLLFVVSLWVLVYGNDVHEDGFTFDMPEDVDSAQPVQPPRLELNRHYAVVGKVFHFVAHHRRPDKGFMVKIENKKNLPHWLVFYKKTATFWGLPLPGDEETLHITVSSLDDSSDSIDVVIQVVAEENDDTSTKKCRYNEGNVTLLTLLLDKKLRSIKPKNRVIAVRNIAKFFNLPYSAFTLNTRQDKNYFTGSADSGNSIGNVPTKSVKDTCYLEVLVCDENFWIEFDRTVRNKLKHTKVDTISEVFGLPLVGWTLYRNSPFRGKRQTVDDIGNAGSGDYTEDDYYDEYEEGEYNENEDLGDVEANPPVSYKPVSLPTNTEAVPKTTTTTTTTTSTTTVPSSTHPHRHHHGEIKPSEQYDPEIVPPVIDEESLIPEIVTEPSSTTTSKPKSFRMDLIPIDRSYDDSDSYDYDAYDDEDDDPVESETIVPIIEDLPKVTSTTQKSTTTLKNEDEEVKSETPVITSTTTTTTTTTETPTTVQIIEDTEPPPLIVYNKDVDEATTQVMSAASTPNVSESSPTTLDTTTTTLTTTLTSTTTTTEAPAITEPVTIKETTTQLIVNISTTERLMTTQEEESTTRVTTPRHISTTVTEEAIIPETVPPVDTVPVPPPQNTKPYIEQRLQFKSVIAGKVFRYEIPKNTFRDAEDGYNLALEVLDGTGQPLSKDSWLQFNPTRRELYGLPLAEDVSNWLYIIRATDKEGASEQDQLTVQVQQHRLERVINHEFALNLRIEKPQEYPHYVDWSLKILRALGRVYNTNMSEITVRHINHTSEPVVFVWSNDSLATNVCERGEIEELFKALTANDRGDPSRELSQLLAPDLRVKKILSKDLTTCEQSQPPPPVTPTTNFSPILRNPVDKVNATLGELLVYKVKDDTFYDPEDVDPSSLNITLLTADLEAIPPTNWLQFDSKNREFFGIPRKTGRTEYFLLCVDTGGMSAKDSLEVVVHPAVKRPYNVEFSMTIGVSVEEFSNNAAMQRKFVEKLMDIFEETTPTNFHFLPFKSKREANFDSTVVYWFNKSLPVESCPIDEIKRLEYMLHSDSRSISSRVHRIMGPEFTVSTIKVHHIGNCKSKPPTIPTPEVPVPSEETPRPQEENDMMITLILPIIIISIMLFVAFVAACILYRKRRIGKMNMEEDGRQSYGNKGIPVIFQEELEEKPEPGTKAPVILKDEKPPLAPPEYSKSGSLKMEDSEPYQPPPPFTRTQDNGRQPRPKPTPTYRKPPPYVPP